MMQTFHNHRYTIYSWLPKYLFHFLKNFYFVGFKTLIFNSFRYFFFFDKQQTFSSFLIDLLISCCFNILFFSIVVVVVENKQQQEKISIILIYITTHSINGIYKHILFLPIPILSLLFKLYNEAIYI